MSRPKGMPKTGGRVKGTPNKENAPLKEAIRNIVEGNVDKVIQMMNLIADPKDYVYLYLKLCEYVIPKQASVSMSMDGKKSDLKSELEKLAEKEI